MADLLFRYAVSFALIGLLYYWARRNRRQRWRRREVLTVEPPPRAARPPAPRAVSLAASLLALNQALETSVTPQPAPGALRSKPQ